MGKTRDELFANAQRQYTLAYQMRLEASKTIAEILNKYILEYPGVIYIDKEEGQVIQDFLVDDDCDIIVEKGYV